MMMKVIFICLLSLTTCLSRPDGLPETPTPKPEEAPNAATTLKPAETTVSSTIPTPATNKSVSSTPAPAGSVTEPTALPTTTKKSDQPTETTTKKPDQTTPVTEKDTDKTTSTLAPAHDQTTSTTKPVSSTKSAPQVPTEPVKPVVAGRGFDGPSFIGGIILTLGLLAVGFMGFKYYRNQTERNYHTL
ncbi:porimin-like [Ostrinia nubilalis]|uniref:porimin-like n=1 Tax=Ostrinia nubilalis TaxID=29057 RepID=UPI00308246A3